MPLQGIDAVNVNTASEAALKDPSIRFAIVKSTEGQGWRNTAYPALKKLARDNGKLFGAYHYAWTNQDPVLEAKNFVEYSALGPGDVAVLDIERQSDLPTSGSAEIKAWWERAIRFSLTWLSEVEAAIGVRPIVYVNNYWRNSLLNYATAEQKAELTSHPLWLAQPGTMGTFTGNTQWGVDIHQYSFETGIDRNWYAHSEKQWQALVIPTPPAPPAPPTTIDQVLEAVKAHSAELAAVSEKITTTTDAINDGVAQAINGIQGANLTLGGIDDSLTAQAIVIEGLAVKADSLSSKTDQVVGGLADIVLFIDTKYLSLKEQNEAIPSVVKDAVGAGLSGFSLSVTYPNKN